VAILKYLALIGTAVSAYAATPACVPPEISPGGDFIVTRFIAAPLPRAHEVIADAMQAAGVLLFKNTEQVVEGERAVERIQVLGLPRGDEAVRAELAPLIQDGKAGAQVRVETLRRGNKKGTPKHAWSAAVLDQAECLVSLLSLDDPSRRPKMPATDGAEIRVADSTSVPVRSRHFLFNTDLKPNQVVPFETAEDVIIDDSIVIPAGSLVAASTEQSTDIGEYGRAPRDNSDSSFLLCRMAHGCLCAELWISRERSGTKPQLSSEPWPLARVCSRLRVMVLRFPPEPCFRRKWMENKRSASASQLLRRKAMIRLVAAHPFRETGRKEGFMAAQRITACASEEMRGTHARFYQSG